jgi:hypothetical protein
MLAAWLLVFHGEAVGELRAIVCEDLRDFDRRRPLEPAQKIDAAVVGHVAVDVQENPTRRAVDGHEQIAAGCLVGHLRQVFDVDVNEARLIVLERLLGRDRLSLGRGNDILQPCHAFAF